MMDYRCEIAGREIALRYTVNSLCAMEERAGGSIEDMMEKQFSAVRLLLWGGMIAGNPAFTVAEAGEMIGAHIAAGGTMEEIVEYCAEGLHRAGFFG